MIIGLSGKKQSGKNLIATIIQYLFMKKRLQNNSLELKETGYMMDKPGFTFGIFSRWTAAERKSYSGFEEKQFASKLKLIICLLIGCTMEELEDNDFKERPLGDEWKVKYFYSPNAISTINEDENLKVPLKPHTPRVLLQLMGTDCGRNIIHPNIWVNATMADYIPDRYFMCDKCMDMNIPALLHVKNEEYVCPNCKGTESKGDVTIVFNDRPSNWIVTDVRFPNEVKALKEKDGIVLRIERDDLTLDTHPSETALDNFTDFDWTIHNSGTIDELIIQVEAFLNHFGLLKLNEDESND